MQKFGEILKEHRLARGLTLKDIEKQIGINNGNLSRWERDEVLPSISACVQLAEYYDLTLDELLGLSDGFRAPTAAPMGESISAEERKLLSVYRSLSPELRETLWGLLATWTPTKSISPVKNKRD